MIFANCKSGNNKALLAYFKQTGRDDDMEFPGSKKKHAEFPVEFPVEFPRKNYVEFPGDLVFRLLVFSKG